MEFNMEKELKIINSWKEKLLDLSLRNLALNLRSSKSSAVSILYPNFQDFLLNCSEGNTYKFEQLFGNYSTTKNGEIKLKTEIKVLNHILPVKDVYSISELQPVLESFAKTKAKKASLVTNLGGKQQKYALNNIFKKSLKFQQERAIDITYLSVGNLLWHDKDNPMKDLYAPLGFIAVQIFQKNIDSDYEIKIKEGSFLPNLTLIKKLQVDFGIDISYNFNKAGDEEVSQFDKTFYQQFVEYRNFVESQLIHKMHNANELEWKILDTLDLGNFYFQNVELIKDIELNTDRILNNSFFNDVIKNEGKTRTESGKKIVQDDQVDDYINPNQYFHILDADSSQEAAIQSAINGASFVLEGPPGTGKSQTITNIISELVARGKKVLFVAEKKAALDVVFRNLKKKQLDSLALAIHDEKFSSKSMIAELYAQLNAAQTTRKIKKEFEQETITKFNQSKNNLNKYYETLTKQRKPFNSSIYELYGLHTLLENQQVPTYAFEIPNLMEMDFDKKNKIILALDTLEKKYQLINKDISSNVWYGLVANLASAVDFEAFSNKFHEAQGALSDLMGFINEVVKKDLEIGFVDTRSFTEALTNLQKIINLSLQINTYDPRIALHENPEYELEKLEELKIALEAKENVKLEICKIYNATIFDDTINKGFNELVSMLENGVNSAGSGFGTLFSRKFKKAKKYLRQFRFDPKITYDRMRSDYALFKKLSNLNIEIEDTLRKVKFRNFYNSPESIDSYIEQFTWLTQFQNLKSYVLTYKSDSREITQKWFKEETFIKKIATQANDKINHVFAVMEDIYKYFEPKMADILSKLKIDLAYNQIKLWVLKLNQARAYSDFNYTFTKLDFPELEEYKKVIVKHSINTDIANVFMKNVYLKLIDLYTREDQLKENGFQYDPHTLMDTFSKVERTINDLSETKVLYEIFKKLPSVGPTAPFSKSVQILQREANKSKKVMPFRELFNTIPDLITQIKPCLMMSPWTISAFLKDTDLEFDTVIFDEASQVFPESAICALFRAKQYIIVGDDKQLPPTNFFHKEFEDDLDDVEASTDGYESILTLARIYLPTITLKWHYRSKFEQLIAPSNRFVYSNKLITFPDVRKNKEYEGIKLQRVNGVFSANTNQSEAIEVINQILNIWEKFGTSKSVGVVTFNNKQQDFIDRKIASLRRNKPEMEAFFSSELADPFFIKNIENVQGDERDIIIVSSCYGLNEAGQFRQNFGPINREGGYKRLNVAFSRAKECLILVTSFDSQMITNENQLHSIEFMKKYWEFAESINKLGAEIENNEFINSFKNFEKSNFEEAVVQELEKHNYKIKRNIGISSYKISIGVLNPQNEEEIIMGIDCDGSLYATSKSARDRERLRKQVLNQRGWNIYRIWSKPWYENNEVEVKQLIEKLEQLTLGVKRATLTGETFVEDDLNAYLDIDQNTDEFNESEQNTDSGNNESDIEYEYYRKAEMKDWFPYYPEYKDYDLDKTQEIIRYILTASPIHWKTIKKLSLHIATQRNITDIIAFANKFKLLLRKLQENGQIKADNNDWYYHPQMIPTQVQYRQPTSEENIRTIDEINLYEYINLITTIISKVEEISKEALFSAISKFLNTRQTPKFKETMENTLSLLLNQGILKISDEDVLSF
ncbi:DUF4011 domain-containing protein [Mycoplasma corogypsi]|uniref:DUF4011 domain-containing protein n=1 Tax=Mycoplasma corogypsi TaxID=2106 RepID=UPI0038733705